MTTPFTVRPAAESDQPAIKALIREGGINPMSLHWSRFLVAVDDGAIVIGCGQVKPHRGESRELASLAVTRPWRRRGVAAAIVTTLQQKHGAPLWLTCMDRLVPFYRPFGFVRIDTLQEMPPYFRRASRFFNIYLAITRGKGSLAVMVWQIAEL